MTRPQLQFHGGRLPNDPSKPRLRLSPFLRAVALPSVKDHVDYLSPVTSWPMYLNDRIGDCTCAAAGHMVEVWTINGQKVLVKITDDDVLKAYQAISGYDPQTGANDNGAVMQDVLNYWRKNGIGGHKIIAFAEVDVQNLDEVRRAIDIFGDIYLGINFPDYAMDQFNAGQPWDYQSGGRIEGGHAINGAWYDVPTERWKVVTWGDVQDMTQAFWDSYVEEAWVAISPDWFDAQGNSPQGLDMHALGEQFAALTGEPNPFPDAPTPQPVPGPVKSPADLELAAAAHTWLGGCPFFYKKFQKALNAWLATKGL